MIRQYSKSQKKENKKERKQEMQGLVFNYIDLYILENQGLVCNYDKSFFFFVILEKYYNKNI